MDNDDIPENPRRDARELARQQAAEDWRWLMSTKQGRRLAHRILSMAGVHRSSFTGNSETFHREGRRALGLEVESEITTHAFPSYIEMLREANKVPQ